jgi:hypothetical protein
MYFGERSSITKIAHGAGNEAFAALAVGWDGLLAGDLGARWGKGRVRLVLRMKTRQKGGKEERKFLAYTL